MRVLDAGVGTGVRAGAGAGARQVWVLVSGVRCHGQLLAPQLCDAGLPWERGAVVLNRLVGGIIDLVISFSRQLS